MEIQFERGTPDHWRNIYLIGYMGTGKSSTAIHLGKILDVPVIELDQVIEDYYGDSIPEIFEEIGEDGFRAMETLMLATSITGCHVPYDLLSGAVFSCGGGIVLNDINIIAMQNSGQIVWLDASPETVYSRLKDSTERPLLKGKMNLPDIQEMMEIRRPYYEMAADYIISTDEKTPEEVAGEIVIALNLLPTLS